MVTNTTADGLASFIVSKTGFATNSIVYGDLTEFNVSVPIGSLQDAFNLLTSAALRKMISDYAGASVYVTPLAEYLDVSVYAKTNVTGVMDTYMKSHNGTATAKEQPALRKQISPSGGLSTGAVVGIAFAFATPVISAFAFRVYVRRSRGGAHAAKRPLRLRLVM